MIAIEVIILRYAGEPIVLTGWGIFFLWVFALWLITGR